MQTTKKETKLYATSIIPRGNGYALSRDLTPRLVPIASCKPLGRETRKHPPQQVRKLAASLERFGFVVPILIDSATRVVAGWGLVQAARQLGHTEVPAICVTDLPEAELRALRLALNRITEDSAWDREALVLEFSEILELAPQLDLEVTGFEMGEIDVILDDDGSHIPGPSRSGTLPASCCCARCTQHALGPLPRSCALPRRAS